MELLILIITLLILAETTVLTIKSWQKPLLSSNPRRKLYVDTSVLMDPRLLAVAQTGFISDEVIIPRSVIHELQLLADGKDHDKRQRARAGLDVVRELERVVYFNLTVLDDALDRTPVDNRLLELAKAGRGAILTNDYNLKKVASAEHIDAISLHELALVLRSEYLPGERARVKLLTAGSSPNQAVAYLKDGTMVVVNHAESKIGEEVEVEFERLNQNAAGTMMFARLVNSRNTSASAPRSRLDASKSKSLAKVLAKTQSESQSKLQSKLQSKSQPKPKQPAKALTSKSIKKSKN